MSKILILILTCLIFFFNLPHRKNYNFFHSQNLTKVLGNLGGFCK